MTTITYIIPFVVAIFLLLFFRKKTAWWEYIILIVPSILLCLFIEFVMKESSIQDTEYLGYYVEKISHYDPWNEYIHRICTRSIPCGIDSKGHTRYRTEIYDCSYVENHPERWTYTMNNGEEEVFYNHREFDNVRKQLCTEPVFVDMNRNYYTVDGDCHEYRWDGNQEHCYTMTDTETYENYLKSSKSLFKYEDISKDEAKKYKLHDYPEIYAYDQNPIIGTRTDKKSSDAIRFINGYYGHKYQFRVYIMVFPKNSDPITAEKERSYLKGSNKNELIVCIGTKPDGHISWCECFSWSDAPVLETKTKDYFLTKNYLDFTGYSKYLTTLLKHKQWKRKNFSDFKYVSVELSDTQVTWLFIIILIYNIGISIWIVMNQFTESDPDGKDRKKKGRHGTQKERNTENNAYTEY